MPPSSALIFIAVLLPFAAANTAIDAMSAISADDLDCMLGQNVTRFIAPVWKTNGIYDSAGIANLEKALSVGYDSVDGVFMPCFTAACAHPENQIEATLNKLKTSNIPIGTLWIYAEVGLWPYDNFEENGQILASFVSKAKAMGQIVGMLASKEGWEANFGTGFTNYADLPLWWTLTDGKADFSTFETFGGWMTPTMHQYQQGHAIGCGGAQIEFSYFP